LGSRWLPDRFEFQLLEDDLEHFRALLELAIGRVPAMQTAGIKQSSRPGKHSARRQFILGEAPEVRGVYVGAASMLSASRQAGVRHGPR
jgi:4-methylaminobutanoate oxidase (formaldehyde-forming)